MTIFMAMLQRWASKAKRLLGVHQRTDLEQKLLQQALKDAIISHDLVAMQESLRQGAQPDWLYADEQTPLHWAAAAGNAGACEVLLGLPIEHAPVTAGLQRSVVLCAITHGHENLAVGLIERGLAVSRPDVNGQGPLHHAAQQGHLLVCQALQRRGIHLEPIDKKGQTPFEKSLVAGQESVALWFLDQTPALAVSCDDSVLPLSARHLHLAAEHGLPLVCIELLRRGFTLNALDEQGQTPLHKAILQDHIDVFLTLVGAGADMGLRDSRGRSALHMAASGGLADMCAVLISHGGDPHAMDFDGRSPKGLAKDNGHSHIAVHLDTCMNALAAKRSIHSFSQRPTTPAP
jgi:ankyrin repeat protein